MPKSAQKQPSAASKATGSDSQMRLLPNFLIKSRIHVLEVIGKATHAEIKDLKEKTDCTERWVEI